MTFSFGYHHHELLNFSDDSTICAAENTTEEFISTLEKEGQAAID